MEDLVQNKHPDIYVEWEIIRDLEISRSECDLVRKVEDDVRKRMSLSELLNHELVRAYRDLFWGLGVDPTKERPSSEALTRRILRGKRLPRINNAVDAMNAASIDTLVTFSILDVDKIEFPIVIRPSSGEEKLVVIGGGEITVPKNFPIIVDKANRILSATIYRDGDYAKVTEETRNVFLIGYLPATLDKSILMKAVKKALEYIDKCCKK